ncbi:hypothetical protein DID88_009933 [Monilinia fructigena]|uniref:RNase H type-1 domain-containing protein n=1 Tax=Monilinia fructigena TaxID=38457 RepID=A0A395IK53_9HELO|nr:hypothetical protein DID88_009933 [Monilinia fructigena]
MLRNGAGRSGEGRATASANGLKVAWANVGRSGPAHIALLQLAFEEGADVVCVQEPSVYPGTRTQNHPAYECYAPVDAWERVLTAEREAERPRAMSYTRKAANLITQQRRKWRRSRHSLAGVPPNFLIGGDFNAKHDMFEPGVGSSNQGASLAAWSLSSGADFIGEPGEPTHRAGHTIDLTFSNIPFAETTVRHDLDCGSDHFTLVTLLPGRGQGADGNAGYGLRKQIYRDDIAALLTTLFQNAIKAVGKRPQGTAKSAPWWTPACAELHAGYASARRRAAPEQERKRRDMLSTIRNAKRDYWRRVIDSAADDADLYKVVGWHKLAPSLKAPPLIVNGVSIESTKEKAEALLEKVLHRYDDSDDLEYDPLEAEGRRPILPWTTAISLEEVEKSVIGVSSTSPGADRRTPDLSQGHPRLWATPTGWAVKPNTKAVYDLILKGSNAALICKATRCTILERVEKWHTYRLAHTPNVLTGLLGNRLVTADVVTEEAEIQTGVRPVNCHSAGTSGSTSVWFISFKEEVRSFTLFGSSGHSKLSEKKKSIETAQPRVPRGASGAACTASPKCTGCHGPFPAGHKHCAATPKRADGKIVRLTASQLGEIRRQQTATRKACELAAKSQQERGPKSGVQVVIPTPGARIAAYEAADQQSRRRVKRKTAPTGSLNLVELSKRSVYAVSDDEPSPTLSRRNGDDRDIVWLEVNGFHIVNVYREPSTRRIIDYITSIQVPPNFLIGGDFNAKHDMFEPGVGSSNQGASLAAWSLSSGADFIGEPGEPTHRAGHTIDLTFSNIPFAETTVRHDLDCGSDHFTLVTLLPGRGQGADGNAGYRVTEANLPRFAHAINSGISHLPQPADVLDTRDLDDIAALLTTLFQNAIKAVGKRPQGTAKSAPWWTPACAELHAGYASARRRAAPEQERKRRDMLSTIRNAKRDYWRRVIDSAADDADLYKPATWRSPPKRSAVDLVASFVYDVESAFAQGKEVTLVTLDVQGAFDALLPRRLLERMRKQGWPGKLLRLIGSFLADRKVMVRLEGTYTAESKTQCGTPQGSPLSPILYVLYLAELLNQDRSLRFGYADDIAIYRASKSVESNVTMLKRDVRQVMRWGAENKVAFAPEKLEMIHLSRKRNTNAPSIRVSPELTITPVTAVGDEQPALRWLGVWIDRKLSFKRHVAERSTKALKVARHIKGLAGVRFGPPAASLRKAVVTCVQSSLLYGSEVWYGGRRKPSASHGYNRNRLVSTRLGPLIEKTNKVMVLAARGVLPAWRTAPTASVLRDAGLPSGSTALEHARIRFALRLRTLDAAHPLVRRLETPILPWQRATKLRCADTLIPYAPRPVLAQPHFSPGCRTDPTEGSTKEAAAEQFNTWWSQLSDNTITVFSDGSEQYKDGAKLVGYGYAIYCGQSLVRTGSGAINSISHVFDAEAIGALKGLQCALEILRPLDEHIWMCIDSTSVIWCMRANASNTSQWAFLECHALIDQFKVGIRWSPGHMGIEGNETADELADAGANEGRMDDDRSAEPTISGIGTTARALADAATSDWWSRCLTGLSASYRKWGLGYSIAEPPELRLPRTLLHRLLAARTAHGDFAQYHRRFGHTRR